MGALDFDNSRAFLWILFLLPLLFLGLRNWLKGRRELQTFGRSVLKPTPIALWIKRGALPLALLFILFALLGPKGNPHYSKEEIEREKRGAQKKLNEGNLILIVDASASMEATDTPSGKSRFEGAKEAADAIVASGIQANFMLYALGGDLVKVVPRTFDKVFVRLLIKQLQINDGGAGTNFLAAFQALKPELDKLPDPAAILLFSDGEDTVNRSISPTDPLKALFGESKRHVPIYTIGLGTSEGAPLRNIVFDAKEVVSHLNRPLLEGLSQSTEGKFYLFRDNDAASITRDLIANFDASKLSTLQTALVNPQESLLWDLYFQIPLFIGILLLIVYLTWPDTRIPKGLTMVMLLAAPLAQEWEKGALLFNRALSKIHDEDLNEAEELLDELNLSPSSSPYVIGKLKEAQASLSFLQANKEKDSETQQWHCYEALLYLQGAEEASCRTQKEKGYEVCTVPYSIDQWKKKAKGSLHFVENDPLGETFKWINRVKLIQAHDAYYEPFLKDASISSLKPLLPSLKKQNFPETLSLLEREKARLLEEARKVPLEERLEKVLVKENLDTYDLIALQDPDLEGAIQKMKRGQRLWSRVLLLVRLQELRQKTYKNETPIDVLSHTLDTAQFALLIQSLSKEIPGFDDFSLLKKVQDQTLAALAPFLKVSE